VADQLSQAGATLLKYERYAEAEKPLRECVAIRARRAPDDWRAFHARSQLGLALQGQGRYAEAEALLRAGYAGMKAREAQMPPGARPVLAAPLEGLVRLYEATGRKEQAAEWRKKLEEAKAAAKTPKP